jgi:hypothetical protein
VDVAKQLDGRDAAHKVEVEQLKGRIVELLEEKEQREGQLKKAQELLVTSETDASNAHAELDGLKEQATKWEVAIAQLNAELASKLQILFFLFAQHTTISSGITFMPTHIPAANILSTFQPCFPLPSKTLRGLCRWTGLTGMFRLTRPTGTCRNK